LRRWEPTPSIARRHAARQKPLVALRIGAEFHDEDDVRYLLRQLDFSAYEQAVAAITRFYPLERFPQKTLYALGELLPRQSQG
jgi:hypothetical protein